MTLGVSLFLIYLLGKLITVAIHDLDFGIAALFVLLWQDALCAALIGAIHRRSKFIGGILYVTALLHFAISMPLLRLMATPLTAPLLSAGGGTLADSIRHHLDLLNVAFMAGTLVFGLFLPLAFAKIPRRVHSAFLAGAAIFAIAGCLLTSSTDLHGLHRNSLFAFVRSLDAPRVSSASIPEHEPGHSSSLHGRLVGANVILIGLESTGAKHLSTYGASADPMPFLDSLARHGVVFESVYAPYPESIKGLHALLFSRQPTPGFDSEQFLPAPGASLAGVLADAGYETALFHSGRFMYLGMDDVVTASGFKRADDAAVISGNHNSSFGVDDFSTVDHLLSWLDTRESAKPFFLHYLPISGHHPYEVPVRSPFAGAGDRSRYLNALRYSDLALKRLVDGLRKQNFLHNTLLVIYGDHGETFGEHPGNYGHTLHLYEENVRVPLILSMPGKLQPARVPRITSLIDLAPTICDLLGLATPQTFHGISAFMASDRPAFFCTDYSLRLRGMRLNDWKLIVETDTGYTRLYDLASDPSEQINLARTDPGLTSSLRARLFGWSQSPASSTIAASPQPVALR